MSRLPPDTSLRSIKGMDEEEAEDLSRQGIDTIRDVIEKRVPLYEFIEDGDLFQVRDACYRVKVQPSQVNTDSEGHTRVLLYALCRAGTLYKDVETEMDLDEFTTSQEEIDHVRGPLDIFFIAPDATTEYLERMPPFEVRPKTIITVETPQNGPYYVFTDCPRDVLDTTDGTVSFVDEFNPRDATVTVIDKQYADDITHLFNYTEEDLFAAVDLCRKSYFPIKILHLDSKALGIIVPRITDETEAENQEIIEGEVTDIYTST